MSVDTSSIAQSSILTPSSTSVTPSADASAYTPSTSTAATTESGFTFPPHYSFPPFFTIQQNITTRASQLSSWSALIQSYCRHHRLFSILPTDALSTPLFSNAKLNRHLSARDLSTILTYMTSPEGGRRAEFADPAAQKAKTGDGEGNAGGKVWIYWRRPEEWAELLERWVESTGQNGAVLTLYEIVESDAARGEEWEGMESEMLRKSLNVLVKKGRAQVFGQGDELGVKFF